MAFKRQGVRSPSSPPERSTCRKASASFLFVVCKKGRGGSKKERHRATVRWTVVTATDQAAQFAARVDPPHLHQKRHLRKQVPLFVISHIRQFCIGQIVRLAELAQKVARLVRIDRFAERFGKQPVASTPCAAGSMISVKAGRATVTPDQPSSMQTRGLLHPFFFAYFSEMVCWFCCCPTYLPVHHPATGGSTTRRFYPTDLFFY